MSSLRRPAKKLNASNDEAKKSKHAIQVSDRRKRNGGSEKLSSRGNRDENCPVNDSFRKNNSRRKNEAGNQIGAKLREKPKRGPRFEIGRVDMRRKVSAGHDKENNRSKWNNRALEGDFTAGKLRSRKGSGRIIQNKDEISQIHHPNITSKGRARHTNKMELSRKYSKEKNLLDENFDYRKQNHSFPFVRSSRKEAKKNINDDSEKMGYKRKRTRIRIDPYDISNKRLGDVVIIDENAIVEEEKNEDKKMSVNALFRAIQPTPSILSFVENNLLGRRRLIDLKRSGYNTDLSAPLDNIPHSKAPERESIEEPVFRNKLTFFAAAKISSSFPPPSIPEIAFAGRSNVGKSSLLNSLTRQWGVVRISDKPGLTQSINFFQLGSKLCLVDLPGYGFAYAKEEAKDAWEELAKEYVSTRDGLKRVCLLIDTKWGMKLRDYELIDLMERSQTKYQVVLTKTDLVFPMDVARRAMQIQEHLQGNKSVIQPVMMASSKSGAGIRSLRTVLANITRFVKL